MTKQTPRRDQHRASDLAKLRAAAFHMPLIIGYDAARRGYTVHLIRWAPPTEPVICARFEVVSAYLAGFKAGGSQ
jgi:hypothetical protein